MIQRPLAQRVGRFRLLEELGRGGMGVVYRATDPSTGSQVALKVLLAAEHAGIESTQRFQREAENARLVQHPNVVQVHDLGWHEGRPYFTMDLVDGGSLEELRGSMRSHRWYARVMRDVALGLHAAHQCGLAHRDVKPANILMEGDSPRLTDFGLARELSSGARRLTATGQVLGTPGYMAPEQAGDADYDPALGDQYSVGAVLYDLLAGRPPHVGDTPVAVLLSVASQRPPSLATLLPTLPLPLVRIIEKAMAREPRHRYADCSALADDLGRFLEGRPVRATGQTLSMWLQLQGANLRRGGAGLAAVAVALLLVLAGAATWRSIEAERRMANAELATGRDILATEPRVEAAIASGDSDEAIRLLRELSTRRAGVDLTLQAVLRHADELSRIAPESLLELLAEHYTSSAAPDVQDRILSQIAATMEADWNWTGLAALNATQVRRHPMRSDSPSIAGPRARVALALGRYDEAARAFAAMDDEQAAAVARAMGQRLAAPDGIKQNSVGDWDGDARPEFAARDHDLLRFHELSANLPAKAELHAPESDSERVLTLPGRRFVHWRDGKLRLQQFDEAGQVHELASARTSAPLSAAVADLRGDGTDEVYVGLGPYDRQLLVARGGTFVDAHAPTRGARSDVVDLLTVGNQLWASVGPWTAYDVRRLGITGDSGLTLLDRRRLGYVSQLVQLGDGRVAALHSNDYPSQLSMTPERPNGPDPGVYFLNPREPAHASVVPWTGPDASLLDLHEADIDGDGTQDLVLSVRVASRPALVVLLGDPSGYRSPLIVPGYELLGAANVDEDPADELLVWESAHLTRGFWLLGTGEPAPVPQGPALVEPRLPPESLDPTMQASWQRAEDLVDMGLYGPAARALQRLAIQVGEPMSAVALGRAAHLLESEGRPDEAAALWAELVDRLPEARERGVQQYLVAHRLNEAARLAGSSPPFGESRWALVEGSERADALTILDPAAVRQGTSGMTIEAVAGEPPLAGARTAWDGTHLAVEFELRIDHLEWGSGVVASIADWPQGDIVIRSWGGGGMYQREVGCTGVPGARLLDDMQDVDVEESWIVRLDWFDGELLCHIRGPDGREMWGRSDVDPPPAGDLDVLLRPASHAPDTHALARAEVSNWTITAANPLPRLSALPTEQQDWTDAHELRVRPTSAVEELLGARGPDALVVFRDVHASLHHAHPSAAVTHRAFTVHAASLLRYDPTRLTPTQRRAYAELLARRGMAWLDLDELDAAIQDLQRSDQLLDEGRPLPLEVDDPLWPLRVDISLALAAAWVGQAPETARRHARHALQLHPIPELARDRLHRHPQLRDLEGLWP